MSENKILKFKIVEKKDISYPGTLRMIYKVVFNVTKLPSNIDMEIVAKEIWNNNNKKWKEFTVFMYLSEMDIKMAAYGIWEFNQMGLVDFSKNKNALIGTKWNKKVKS